MTIPEFITQMNASLIDLEHSLRCDEEDEHHANIMILGLPRSGTTLLAQTLFHTLDVACTNNLVARFWQTPLVGMSLSESVLGRQRLPSFSSSFGRTEVVTDPHEFSWFWQRHLLFDTLAGTYDYGSVRHRINWRELKRDLVGMNCVADRPLVHKPLEFAGYFIDDFVRMLPCSVFVHIERDPAEVARSIAHGRLARAGNIDTWWSSYPREYPELATRQFADQIGGQVHYLSEMYKTALDRIPEPRLVRTTYQDLCADPMTLVERVSTSAKSTAGHDIAVIGRAGPFTPSRPKSLPDAIERRMSQALRNWGLDQ